MWRAGIALSVLMAAAGVSAGQPPPPQGTPSRPAPTQPAQVPAGQAASAGQTSRTDQLVDPSGFAYTPEGRRDPFVSLVRRGSDTRSSSASPRPAGLAGLGVAEITLRGTIRSREGFVAIMQGSDQKTYIVRPGDKLFDGTVRTVTEHDVVIQQQVDDPLSLEKQREVRKGLRQTEAN